MSEILIEKEQLTMDHSLMDRLVYRGILSLINSKEILKESINNQADFTNLSEWQEVRFLTILAGKLLNGGYLSVEDFCDKEIIDAYSEMMGYGKAND